MQELHDIHGICGESVTNCDFSKIKITQNCNNTRRRRSLGYATNNEISISYESVIETQQQQVRLSFVLPMCAIPGKCCLSYIGKANFSERGTPRDFDLNG